MLRRALATILPFAALLAACGDTTPEPAPSASWTAQPTVTHGTPAGTPSATELPSATPTPTADPSGAPSIRWTFDVGGETYVLAGADETLVVAATGPHYDFKSAPRLVVGLEPETGVERWRKEMPCAPFQPLVAGGAVFVPCNDGVVYAFERDGRERWEFDSGAAPFRMLLVDGVLLLDDVDPEAYGMGDYFVAHRPHGLITAVDAASGQLRWRQAIGSADTYIAADNQRVYVGSDELTALDLRSGAVVWGTRGIGGADSVWGYLDSVIVSARRIRSLDAATGALRWESERQAENGGVVIGDRLYGVESYGADAFFALDLSNGNEVQRRDWCDCGFGVSVRGNDILSAIGAITLIDPATMTVRWTLQIDDEYGFFPPVVEGEWIFVGSGGTGRLYGLR